MQRLVFWLVYPFLWIISKLPFPLFYKISDLICFVVYHIIGYRKKTVSKNLQLAFPQKSREELKKIEIKFYRHMCDMFLEMIKSISISNEELKKRFTFTNVEEIRKIRGREKSIILMCGHYASYEWVNALQLYDLDYRGFGIYKRIQNRYFNKMAQDIRGRFDGELITTSEATKTIKEYQKKGIMGVYAMVADQSPKLARAKFWTNFMGTTVPVFLGSEVLARDLDMVVIYLHVEKVKRGFYKATFIPISDKPSQEPPYFITEKYLDEVEKQINEAPEYYLWTHKRWKHKNASIPADATVHIRN